MNDRKIFVTERIGPTLVVAPRSNVSTLASDRVLPELREILRQFDQTEAVNVLVDLQDAACFGSLMLGAMHKMWGRVRSTGKMAVCNVSPVGHEVLEVARLDTLWPVYPSRPEALAALSC